MNTGNSRGYLLLEDGRTFAGNLYGWQEETTGEVVFNTAMSGYQEVLYDPSYWNQIVIMTTAHIGNTGVNNHDNESRRPFINGFAARSFTKSSNWRAERSLSDMLIDAKIPGIQGLDTRSVTKHLRQHGSMRGGIFHSDTKVAAALQTVLASPSMDGMNGAAAVQCDSPYDWSHGTEKQWLGRSPVSQGKKFRVAVIDYGVKQNILRRLVDVGCAVKVYPYSTNIKDVLAYKPDGILLSNGPGDPAAVSGAAESIRSVLGKIPIFGICLGHQLLAIAAGASTHKMKFGHRGINHPVGLDKTGRIIVSVHNHGFAVTRDSLPSSVNISLCSLNDDTVEGLDYPVQKAFSVQFHPEASPGPHDSSDLFVKFRSLMEQHASQN